VILFFLFISILSLIYLQQSVRLLSQTLTMYYFLAGLFLPMINALLTVHIHQHATYYPNSSCAFLRNTSLSNDASIQSCIWACQDEYDCQTAVYYNDNKTCLMFSEVCTTGCIESSGNDVASVICHRKNHREFSCRLKHQQIFFVSERVTTCSSALTTVVDVTTNTMESMCTKFVSIIIVLHVGEYPFIFTCTSLILHCTSVVFQKNF
jgi:hypothetical protein